MSEFIKSAMPSVGDLTVNDIADTFYREKCNCFGIWYEGIEFPRGNKTFFVADHRKKEMQKRVDEKYTAFPFSFSSSFLFSPSNVHCRDQDDRCLSAAVFPSASFFNHSCIPNATRFDDVNGLVAIRALYPIKAGVSNKHQVEEKKRRRGEAEAEAIAKERRKPKRREEGKGTERNSREERKRKEKRKRRADREEKLTLLLQHRTRSEFLLRRKKSPSRTSTSRIALLNLAWTN